MSRTRAPGSTSTSCGRSDERRLDGARPGAEAPVCTVPERGIVDFREDGAAALEWAARYLERVPELPVLAQVEPGELTAQLPGTAPEQPEPFADVLRDLD